MPGPVLDFRGTNRNKKDPLKYLTHTPAAWDDQYHMVWRLENREGWVDVRGGSTWKRWCLIWSVPRISVGKEERVRQLSFNLKINKLKKNTAENSSFIQKRDGTLKGETVPESLPATPKSPPTRRVPPRARIYNGAKTASSVNGAGKTRQLHVKELN